jgi:hypothetical protein
MKKIFILLVALFGLIKSSDAQTTYTWTGGGATTSYTEAANWSGTVVPTTLDNIVFDGTSSKNCDLDDQGSGQGLDVHTMNVTSAYSGTITGVAATHYIAGSFTLAGGTFVSSAGDLGIEGDFVFTGGTFLHNGGSVSFWVNGGSTNSISGALTFNQLIINPNGGSTTERIMNFGSSASTTDLIISNGTKLFSFQGNLDITGSVDVSSGSNTQNPSSNSGTFAFSGAGPVTITGPNSSTKNKLPNITMNTSGNYSMSGNINLQGNWTHTSGTLTTGGGSTVNMYGTSNSISGNARFNNLAIQSGAVIAMPAGAEVRLQGNLSGTGTLNFQTTTSLGFDGTGAQSLSRAVTLAAINAYNGGSSRTVSTNSAVIVLDSVHVENNTTLASGGKITLRSTNALTARVGQLLGTANITGNVTVETLIPGGTAGWANLGVRGVASQTVGTWDTYASSGGANGIPMTCTGCTYDIFSAGGDFHSIQGYLENDPTGFHYDTNVVATTPLSPGTGFWVYVASNTSSANDMTLINTGSLVQGTVNVLVTAGTSGDNLVANPYPSPIEWDKVVVFGNNGNTLFGSQTIYAWSADVGMTHYNNGVGNPGAPSGIDNFIPGGQGFFVEQVSQGNLEFDETVKATQNTSANPLVRPAANPNRGKIFRLRIKGGNNEWDGTTFRFHGNAKPNRDVMDAKKIFMTPGYAGWGPTYSKYTTISSQDGQGQDYAINSLPLLTQDVTLPVLARVSTSGSYTIELYDNEISSCIKLRDKLTNTETDLTAGSYVFTINDTTSVPRFELFMCRDESVNPTSIKEVTKEERVAIGQDVQGAFVMYDLDKGVDVTISAYNIVGQKLMNDIPVRGTGEMGTQRLNLDVHNQVVIIKVAGEQNVTTKKIVTH